MRLSALSAMSVSGQARPFQRNERPIGAVGFQQVPARPHFGSEGISSMLQMFIGLLQSDGIDVPKADMALVGANALLHMPRHPVLGWNYDPAGLREGPIIPLDKLLKTPDQRDRYFMAGIAALTEQHFGAGVTPNFEQLKGNRAYNDDMVYLMHWVYGDTHKPGALFMSKIAEEV